MMGGTWERIGPHQVWDDTDAPDNKAYPTTLYPFSTFLISAEPWLRYGTAFYSISPVTQVQHMNCFVQIIYHSLTATRQPSDFLLLTEAFMLDHVHIINLRKHYLPPPGRHQRYVFELPLAFGSYRTPTRSLTTEVETTSQHS